MEVQVLSPALKQKSLEFIPVIFAFAEPAWGGLEDLVSYLFEAREKYPQGIPLV